jgi:DNA-binding NtrC family response regulator
MEVLQARLARIAAQNVTVFVSGDREPARRGSPAPCIAFRRAAGAVSRDQRGGFPEALLEDELFGRPRLLHGGRPRRAGLFEAASGALFLDGIADLSLALGPAPPGSQERVKRVARTARAVDVRLGLGTAPISRTRGGGGRVP